MLSSLLKKKKKMVKMLSHLDLALWGALIYTLGIFTGAWGRQFWIRKIARILHKKPTLPMIPSEDYPDED